MAVDTNISMAAAIAGLDAVVDLAENGTGGNCRVRIYDGSKPATPDDAVGTQTLLAEIDLGASTPIFSAATTGTGGSTNSATANASSPLPKTQTSATASGTATWFRAVDKGTNAVIDGTCGTSSADMILDNTSINAGQQVKLNSWKIKLSRGS